VSEDTTPGASLSPMARRVYDGDQVDIHLARLHEVIDDLRRQLVGAQDRVSAAEQRLADAAWSEGLIGRTLILAERAAEQTRHEAQVEVERQLVEARRQAEVILAQARARADSIIAEHGGVTMPPPLAPVYESPFAPPRFAVADDGEPASFDGALDFPPPEVPVLADAPAVDRPEGGNGRLGEVVDRVRNGEVFDRLRAARTGELVMFKDEVGTRSDGWDDDSFFAALRAPLPDEAEAALDRPDEIEAATPVVDAPAPIFERPVEPHTAADGTEERTDDEKLVRAGPAHSAGRASGLGLLLFGVISPGARLHRRRRRNRPVAR
jgi:hypothetical protein